MNDQTDRIDRISVLLVDDERSLLEPLTAYLSGYFSVTPAENGKEALRLVDEKESPFDVALVDESLAPGPNGIELMKIIRSRHSNTEVIIFTGWGTDQRQNALRAGAFRHMEKPFNREELVLLIRSAAQIVRQRSISQQMLATHGLDNLLQVIITAARSLVFADDAALVVDDPVAGRRKIEKSPLARQAQPCFYKHLDDASLTDRILAGDEIYSVPDIPHEKNIDQCLKDSGYQSFIGLPIPGETGNQGVLYVYSRTPHHFDELGHTALLRTIAAQAGLALTNAWAEDQIELHSQNMEALVRVGREFSASASLEDLYFLAWQFVRERLGFGLFFIAAYDPEKDELSFPIYYDDGQPMQVASRKLADPADWGLTGIVVKHGQEIFYCSQAEGEALARAAGTRVFVNGKPAECCFFYPLCIDGQVAGVISVQSQLPNGLPALYIETLRALGNHLAVAIKNVRMHAAQQHHHQETEYKNALLKAMTDAMNLLRSEKEPAKLLYETIHQAAKLLKFKYGALFYYNAQIKELELISSYNLPGEHNRQRASASDSLAGQAASAEKLKILNADYQAAFPNDRLLAGLGLATTVALPIKHPNQPEMKRVLLLADDQPHEVTPTDHEVLTMLASRAAIAIRTSELINDEKRHYEQLTILQKINEFIQARRKLDDILHLILTGITAGYGLGFNRAILLMVDRAQNGLVGRMAIGNLDADTAQVDWTLSHQSRMDDFKNYLRALYEGRLPTTPLDDAVRGRLFCAPTGALPRFLQRLVEKGCLTVSPSGLDHVPEFRQAIQPISEIVAVPLISAGEVIGLIIVDNKFDQAPISLEDEGALLAFANTAAVAVENERLLSTLVKTRAAALEINQVSVLGDLPQTLESIREGARQVLDCDIFTLYIFDSDTRRFVGREHYGCLDESNIRPAQDLRPTSSAYKLIDRAGDPYYCTEDSQNDLFFQGSFAQNEHIQATLAIKLVYMGEPVGALFINYRQPHHFTHDEIENALLFADQAAIAIQNARLYERSRQHAALLNALYEAGKVITASLSLKDTLRLLAVQARTLTGPAEEADRFCNVLLPVGHKLRFEASAPEGLIAQEIDLQSTPHGITGRTFTSGQSQLVDNVHEDPDYVVFKKETVSELCVPLKIGDQVIGVINVESHTPAAFKQQDRLNLELLAAQAAIAIQNGRAFDDLHKAQGTIAARTNLVYWGMESAVWRHAINNYALTIFEQAGLFRSNLTKRTLSQADKQKLFERLDMIQNLAQRIQDKRFTPPLSSEEGVEPVLIGQLVRERANQLVDRYGNPGILQPFMLEPDSQVMVWASPEWLRLAVDILVDNAVKAVHGRPQQQVTVGVCLLPNQREVKIFVRDTGPGISLEYQEILGDEYIPRSPGRPGMGLGLAMAKMIARTYQGKLEIASTGAQGTEMTITLPVYQPAPAGGAKG